jgi:hypothetical protein
MPISIFEFWVRRIGESRLRSSKKPDGLALESGLRLMTEPE